MTPGISVHAVKRYMERTGCKSAERAKIKIEHCFLNGKKLKTDPRSIATKIYGSGFVLCIVNNVVVTVYRPKGSYVQSKIYNAHKNERERTKALARTTPEKNCSGQTNGIDVA